MADQTHQPNYRRRREASEYIRKRFGFDCTVSTLAKLAVYGGGPRFAHVGRAVLYPGANSTLGRCRASRH